MAVRTTWNNAVEGQPDYDEQDLRNLLNAFLSTGDATSSNKVVGGILRTGQGEDLRVSTNGTYNFTVKPGRAVVPATAGGEGAFTVYNDTETSFPIEEVADATYSRLDSVYIRAFSPALGDAETGGEIGIVYGNFASVPTAPAIPDNSIRLAVIEVPPAGNPVSVQTDTRRWLAAPGGALVASSSSELENYRQGAIVGQLAVLTNPYSLYVRDTTAWRLLVTSASSTWQNLQLNPNYTNQAEYPQVKKVGDYVQWRGNFKRKSDYIGLPNETTMLVRIPSSLPDYMPTGRRIFLLPCDGPGRQVRAIVNTDGTVSFDAGDNSGVSWIDLSPIGY